MLIVLFFGLVDLVIVRICENVVIKYGEMVNGEMVEEGNCLVG